MQDYVDLQWVRADRRVNRAQSQLSQLGSYTKRISQNAFERISQVKNQGSEKQLQIGNSDLVTRLHRGEM